MTATKTAAPPPPMPANVARAAQLGDDAAKALRPGLGSREYVAALLAASLFRDAVRFVAFALPRREAVWWALLCAREAAGDAPPPAVRAALDATDTWVRHPGDEQRRAAMAAAKTAEFSTSAGCAGLAAFLSGGSLSVPGQPDVPPGPFECAKAAFGAVAVAAIGTDAKTANDRYRRYVEQGLHIGEGAGAWHPGGKV